MKGNRIMNSDKIKNGPGGAPVRSLFYGMGMVKEEIERPLIGVVNAQNELIPGHLLLDRVAQAVKKGIIMAGGTPVEFPAIGICDGIAMGHEGMKYPLASRELICDSIEAMALLSIKGENYDSARKFLDTILKIDPDNESAVEYGKEFETKVVEEAPETSEPEKKDKKKKEKKKAVSQTEEPKKKKNPFNISSIQENEAGKSPMFYMVTGIVIGVIVAAVLIYPTVRASFSHKNSTQVEDYKEQILAKDTQLKASEKKVKEAQAAQKKAENELDEYIGTSKKDGVYDLLLSALQKYSDRDYTGSADALLDIDSKKLTTKNMKTIYKDLTTKVYPSAATGLYSKGKKSISSVEKEKKLTLPQITPSVT